MPSLKYATFDICDIWHMGHLTGVTFDKCEISAKKNHFISLTYVTLTMQHITDSKFYGCDIWHMRHLTDATLDIFNNTVIVFKIMIFFYEMQI